MHGHSGPLGDGCSSFGSPSAPLNSLGRVTAIHMSSPSSFAAARSRTTVGSRVRLCLYG
jgi:hypothetical protein